MAAPGLSCSMWDLVSWPGIEPGPPALGAQCLNHWASREVPRLLYWWDSPSKNTRILLRLNWYKKKIAHVKLIQFDEFETCIYPWYKHHNQGNKHVHYLQKFPCGPLWFLLLFVVRTLNWKKVKVMSHSLGPHGLYSPWNSPGQNTEAGSLSLLQQIFPTRESNWDLKHEIYLLTHFEAHNPVSLTTSTTL